MSTSCLFSFLGKLFLCGRLFGATLKRQASLGQYTLNVLLQSMETKDAMKYSRQHFSSLVGLAHAFKSADINKIGMRCV